MPRKPRGGDAMHRMTSRKAEPAAAEARDPAYEPARTPLGAELRRLRAEFIESGEPLLAWEDIDKEVAERRGGVG